MTPRQCTSVLSLVTVAGLADLGNAALIIRGTDILGNRLIYDTDRDITWYDFTYHTSYCVNGSDPSCGWLEAVYWADSLTVNFGGMAYSGWRLPSAGPDPQSGYNQTTPEMGHLYYVELGNRAYPEPGWGLQNTGPFQHLTGYYYWSAERYAAGQDAAWVFAFSTGSHAGFGHTDLPYYALAVRPGNVNCVDRPGDFNLDCDVDAADFAVFEACSTGPAIPYNPAALPEPAPGCTLPAYGNGKIKADFDADGDVDQSDFGIFQRCYSGENNPADPNCAD